MNHEGTLRIVHLDADRRSGKPQYSVTYVPYSRGGGALPRRVIGGDDQLRDFLREVQVDQRTIDETLAQVRTAGSVSLQRIVLSDEQLQQHGLQEMGILESVISYLST